MKKKIPLEEGEIVEARSAGALSLSPSGRWRLGEWVKTGNRVLFLQGGNVNFSAALNCLTDVERGEREYSFTKKACLKILWRKSNGESQFWLIVPDIKAWEGILACAGQNRINISERDMAILAGELDPEAEGLLWFIYRRRHATIGELASHAGADNHMVVLERIRREINPAAEKVLGGPAMVFRQRWIDPLSGRNGKEIKFSWWLADSAVADEPFYDVIDEGEFYRVIVESDGATETSFEGHVLKATTGVGHGLSISLPDVDALSPIKKKYQNGILEMQIAKASSG